MFFPNSLCNYYFLSIKINDFFFALWPRKASIQDAMKTNYERELQQMWMMSVVYAEQILIQDVKWAVSHGIQNGSASVIEIWQATLREFKPNIISNDDDYFLTFR